MVRIQGSDFWRILGYQKSFRNQKVSAFRRRLNQGFLGFFAGTVNSGGPIAFPYFIWDSYHWEWAMKSMSGWGLRLGAETSPQMVMKSKGIPNNMPEEFRFRNYSSFFPRVDEILHFG